MRFFCFLREKFYKPLYSQKYENGKRRRSIERNVVIVGFDYTSTEQQLGTKYMGGQDVQRISWMLGNVSGNFNILIPVASGTIFRIIDISGSIQETATSPIYPLNYSNGTIFFRAYINDANRLYVESNYTVGHVHSLTLTITYIKRP